MEVYKKLLTRKAVFRFICIAKFNYKIFHTFENLYLAGQICKGGVRGFEGGKGGEHLHLKDLVNVVPNILLRNDMYFMKINVILNKFQGCLPSVMGLG